MNSHYVVEFPNCGKAWWIATWTKGDMPRTILRESAKKFRTERSAKTALAKYQAKYYDRGLEDGKIVKVN